jgi:uncharacterized membrane protein YeiH
MFEELFFTLFVAAGTIAFALSGSLKGIRHNLDLLGITVLGFVTALGGGLIRDALLHQTPVAFVEIMPSVYAAIGCIIAMLSGKISLKIVAPLTHPESKTFLVIDAIGLASFTVLGARMGADAGLNLFGIVLLAAITGVGGSIIRDILVTETPLVLKADFYATATIIGAVVFALLYLQAWNETVVLIVTFLVTLFLRLAAIWRHWQLPKLK